MQSCSNLLNKLKQLIYLSSSIVNNPTTKVMGLQLPRSANGLCPPFLTWGCIRGRLTTTQRHRSCLYRYRVARHASNGDWSALIQRFSPHLYYIKRPPEGGPIIPNIEFEKQYNPKLCRLHVRKNIQ